jgi:hypothetical protein
MPKAAKNLSRNFHDAKLIRETVSPPASCDSIFENHFSLFLIRPVSPTGRNWLDQNIADDVQTLGEAVACEGRYVEAIYHGAINVGLVCR